MIAQGVGLLAPFAFPPLALLMEVVAAAFASLPILLTAPQVRTENGAFALMG